MTQEFLELLGNVTRTGYRLIALGENARSEGKEDVANLLEEAYDAVYDAQLILESEKEGE